MEADLDVSLIVRKGRSLSGQNDWRSPVYVSEKSDNSLEDRVKMFWFKIMGSFFFFFTYTWVNWSQWGQ